LLFIHGPGGLLRDLRVPGFCVGQDDPKAVEVELREKGLTIVDLPAAAASICGRAYTRYRTARKRSGSKAPMIPLPDFFIGAHAELTDWALATREILGKLGDSPSLALFFGSDNFIGIKVGVRALRKKP
jgi:hypothetical protein